MKIIETIKNHLKAFVNSEDTLAKRNPFDEISVLVPSGKGWLRAVVATIPYVGGGLDHLFFDKYAEIQHKNVLCAIDEIKKKMKSMEEQMVCKEWFESVEALDLFRNLLQRVMFEGDGRKIKTLCCMYCLFGTKDHVLDPNKYAVLDVVAKLTNNQKLIFLSIDDVPKCPGRIEGGDYIVARWGKTIVDCCKKYQRYKSK